LVCPGVANNQPVVEGKVFSEKQKSNKMFFCSTYQKPGFIGPDYIYMRRKTISPLSF